MKKNSKSLKRVSLASAALLTAFTLSTAVAPTFATTVHADEVSQQGNYQPEKDPAHPEIPDMREEYYFITEGAPAEGYPFSGIILAYNSASGELLGNTEYTPNIEGYEVDPTRPDRYYNQYSGDSFAIRMFSYVILRYYRPIGSVTPTTPDTPNRGSDVPGSDVPGSDVPGSDVPGSDVPGSDVPGSDVPGSDVPGSDVPGSDLPGSDVPGSDVPGSDVPGSDVPGSDVPGSDVPGSDVPGSDVPGSNATGSNATGSNATGSNATGSNAASSDVQQNNASNTSDTANKEAQPTAVSASDTTPQAKTTEAKADNKQADDNSGLPSTGESTFLSTLLTISGVAILLSLIGVKTLRKN